MRAPAAAPGARRALLDEIRAMARATAPSTGRPALAAAVMAALERVPRDAFVPPQLRELAWRNRPLPIGCGQTISQPFIVALMTDLLDPRPGDHVLEIGTGCGYQAAVLAGLVGRVTSIERIPELADAARARLAGLGIGNVAVVTGDGRGGWPQAAPYRGILVTAAAPQVPPALAGQLAAGGRLVVPVGAGGSGGVQQLTLVTRRRDGRTRAAALLDVAFVPLVGDG